MPNTFMLGIAILNFVFQYRERDLNPHSHHWPKDFKSFVSTDSTIRAALDEYMSHQRGAKV